MDGLQINGRTAWTEWGVMMGKDFLSSLNTPAPMKDYIVNSSCLENGKRYMGTPKVDERSLTLTFNIHGDTAALFRQHRDDFLAMLQAGDVIIHVPDDGENYYHLKYTGKSISYAQNKNMTFCVLKVGFIEPDPTDRNL